MSNMTSLYDSSDTTKRVTLEYNDNIYSLYTVLTYPETFSGVGRESSGRLVGRHLDE